MELAIDSKITLNDGHVIPQIGLGVWQARAGTACETAVLAALEAGYRHIDTAAMYGNEESVGPAIRMSDVRRENIFVTTKLSNADHQNPERALDTSLRKLNLDYVDLYLIHYPVPERRQSWRVLEGLQAQGKTRSIGVSNFTIRHLTELLAETDRVPAVNQVEFHPYLYQRDLLDFCIAKGIVIEAYSPLTHGKRLNDPRLVAVAKRYSKVGLQRRPAGRNSLLSRNSPADLESDQRHKSSSAGHCNTSWWLFRNRPDANASARMPMCLILKLPKRICSSSMGLMKTSEYAGTRPTRPERGCSATLNLTLP